MSTKIISINEIKSCLFKALNSKIIQMCQCLGVNSCHLYKTYKSKASMSYCQNFENILHTTLNINNLH